MYRYAFEKLKVWHESKELAVSIYKITKGYPKSERYGLTDQLRRASVSICSNIAEGTAYNTQKQQLRFYTIAFGSAVEILNQLIISKELSLVNEEQYQRLRKKIESITNKLNAIRNHHINK